MEQLQQVHLLRDLWLRSGRHAHHLRPAGDLQCTTPVTFKHVPDLSTRSRLCSGLGMYKRRLRACKCSWVVVLGSAACLTSCGDALSHPAAEEGAAAALRRRPAAGAARQPLCCDLMGTETQVPFDVSSSDCTTDAIIHTCMQRVACHVCGRRRGKGTMRAGAARRTAIPICIQANFRAPASTIVKRRHPLRQSQLQ